MTQLTLKDLEKTLDEKLKVNNTNLKEDFREELREQLKINNTNLKEGIRDEIKVATRDIISHFNASQGEQNERLDRIEEKIDDIGDDVAKVKLAVVDLMGTDRHLHNLVDELNQQGIVIDKQKVFAR